MLTGKEYDIISNLTLVPFFLWHATELFAWCGNDSLDATGDVFYMVYTLYCAINKEQFI